MPAIATKLLLLLYFSQHVSAPSSGGIQHQLSFQSAINTATDLLQTRQLMLYST
jgi:hypothetical protein